MAWIDLRRPSSISPRRQQSLLARWSLRRREANTSATYNANPRSYTVHFACIHTSNMPTNSPNRKT